MIHDTLTTSPAHPLPIVPVRARHDGWTAVRQRQFLEELAATGVVREAAARVDMRAESAYRLRQRAGSGAFARAWDAALFAGRRRLVATAYDRAINGVVRPIFYKGEQIGEERRFNDNLLMFLITRPGECFDGEDADICLSSPEQLDEDLSALADDDFDPSAV